HIRRRHGRRPGVELAAHQEDVSAYRDFLMAAISLTRSSSVAALTRLRRRAGGRCPGGRPAASAARLSSGSPARSQRTGTTVTVGPGHLCNFRRHLAAVELAAFLPITAIWPTARPRARSRPIPPGMVT